MKKSGFNIHKLGNLTINFFTNEVVFIYIGKRSTYIRSICKKKFVKLIRVFVIFVAVFIFIPLIFAVFARDGAIAGDVENKYVSIEQVDSPSQSNDDMQEDSDSIGVMARTSDDLKSIIEDEKKKNELMISDETNFSAPDKDPELKIIKHQVVRGENLSVIAKKYGVSIDTICGSNNLRSYDFIQEGAILRIPNKDGILYNMKSGSNIVKIAQKYKISVKKILSQNNFKNSDFISEGQLVFIPDAKPQNIISGFMWPTQSRRITSGFGWRHSPFDRSYKEFHKGMDIATRYQSVRATKYGKVTYAGWMGGYGKAVIIAHPNGWKSLYGHLSRIYVRSGQYVKQGQTVARSGNTGRSTGPHLHFELIKKGSHLNPKKYLNRR